MADVKKKRKIRPASSPGPSQQDLLLKAQLAAMKNIQLDMSTGVIDDATFKARMADVAATGENLSKERQGMLALRMSEALRTPRGSSIGATRGREIVLSGGRVPAPQLVTQSRPSELLGGNIRTPAVRVGARALPPDPISAAIAAGRIEGSQRATAQAAQEAANAKRVARVQAAAPRIEAAIGKIRIPGYFGSSPATANPAVTEAVTRLRASKTPQMAGARGKEAIRIARSQAASNAGKATAGKGLLAGGAAALVGLIASKAFGKNNEIDPQMQMALMQQMGAAQQGGGDSSKQLMDLSRALTVVKKLQELAAVQGPAAMRPRLI